MNHAALKEIAVSRLGQVTQKMKPTLVKHMFRQSLSFETLTCCQFGSAVDAVTARNPHMQIFVGILRP